jgi:uncharacterized protein (DUF2461 family)
VSRWSESIDCSSTAGTAITVNTEFWRCQYEDVRRTGLTLVPDDPAEHQEQRGDGKIVSRWSESIDCSSTARTAITVNTEFWRRQYEDVRRTGLTLVPDDPAEHQEQRGGCW